MSKQAKWITVGLVVLVVAGLGAATAMRSGNKPTDVKVEKVETRDLIASVTAG